MDETDDNFRCRGGFSSPPCFAAEVAPGHFDPLAVDPQQALDVARWRRAERRRLLDARRGLDTADRDRIAQGIIAGVRSALDTRFGDVSGLVIGLTWPIRGEPDLRPLMAELHAAGAVIALPLAATPAAPLAFRRWTSRTRMVRGHWNIPVPPPDEPLLTPEVAVAPVVGWDPGGYRLGYGGGYFDRTLAALSPRPFTIATGPEAARLPTIYPQPHDIPFDLVVTECGACPGDPR